MAALQTANDEIFEPPFFNQLHLKGFPIRNLSVKSRHTQNIKDSIKVRGYDEDKPIIVATSKDAEANGYVLDGRNRLVACYWIEQESGQLPAITIKHEQVKDLAHAKMRQIYYESQHLLNKPSEDACDHILVLYEEVKELDPSITKQSSLVQYLGKEAKFDNETMLKAVVSRIEKHEKKQQDLARDIYEPRRPSQDEEAKGSWATGVAKDPRQEQKEMSFKSYAGELELTCNHGKKMNIALNIKIFDDGTTKLEQVA